MYHENKCVSIRVMEKAISSSGRKRIAESRKSDSSNAVRRRKVS